MLPVLLCVAYWRDAQKIPARPVVIEKSEGFSEKKFHSIRKGMTPEEVEEVAGTPLAKGVSGPWEVWMFAQRSQFGHLLSQRLIRFHHGKVREIVSIGSRIQEDP